MGKAPGPAHLLISLLDCETILISAQTTARGRGDLFIFFYSSPDFGRKNENHR